MRTNKSTMNHPDPIKQYLADIGRKGGKSTSDAKKRASQLNGKKRKKQPKVKQ